MNLSARLVKAVLTQLDRLVPDDPARLKALADLVESEAGLEEAPERATDASGVDSSAPLESTIRRVAARRRAS